MPEPVQPLVPEPVQPLVPEPVQPPDQLDQQPVVNPKPAPCFDLEVEVSKLSRLVWNAVSHSNLVVGGVVEYDKLVHISGLGAVMNCQEIRIFRDLSYMSG